MHDSRAITTRLLAVVVALVPVLALAGPESRPARKTQATPPAPPARVIIIGMDGASWNVLDPFIEKGVTPNLAALAEEGARGDFASYWPMRTPQVWTSMVTGKKPGQHGIWDHVSSSRYSPPPMRTEERKRLTTADRKSRALWDLLGTQGFRTLSVGWIASWPAEKAPGSTIVAPVVSLDDSRQSTIKGSFWRDSQQVVAPASLWPRVKKMIVEPDDVRRKELAAFAEVPEKGSPLLELPFMKRYLYTLRWSIARARSVEAMTLGLYDTARPDVLMSYFQCSDSLSHRFWVFKKGEAAVKKRLTHHKIPTRDSAELARRFGGVVEACWKDVDARIGRILEKARGPDTLVLIVTDHGFGEAPEPHPDPKEPYGGNHLDAGLFIAAGPTVPSGSTIEGASVLDVTPTLLYHFGLPVADDMLGKPIGGLYREGWLTRFPPRRTATYERKPQTKVPFAQGYPSRKDRPLASSRP